MAPPELGEDLAVADEALGAELLAVVARLNRLAMQRARMPLPFAAARLLSTIEDQGAARISDLAALDHCSQPTMTSQVRRLEDSGLVSRTVDPSDARAVLIRLTPKGVKSLRLVAADRGAAIDPLLFRLGAAERQTLAEAVRILRVLLDDAAPPSRNQIAGRTGLVDNRSDTYAVAAQGISDQPVAVPRQGTLSERGESTGFDGSGRP